MTKKRKFRQTGQVSSTTPVAGQTKSDKAEDKKPEPFSPPGELPVCNTLTAEQVRLMKDLVNVQTKTHDTKAMRSFIRTLLKEIPGVQFWTHEGNIYAIKESDVDVYPCVVCHTDTVHSINWNVRCFQAGDVLFAFDTVNYKTAGTGGDDKVGIFMAIECLKKFKALKVVFFRDEESGCNGSERATMNFFKDCSMVLQADRRGRYDITEDIGNMPMLTDEFKKATEHIVKKYGRTYVTGMMTDVLRLAEKGLEVCACNMSCGYYDPHTSQETIHLLHMEECFKFMCDLIEEVGFVKWPFQDRDKKKKKYVGFSTGGDSGHPYHDDWDGGRGWEWSTKGGWRKKVASGHGNHSVSDTGNGSVVKVSTGKNNQLAIPLLGNTKPWEEQGGTDFMDGVNGVKRAVYRTSFEDYCENCGLLLSRDNEKTVGHCEECYLLLTSHPMPHH